MAIINLYPFGEINTNEPEEYYESEIQISDKTISVDLNFEEGSIDEGDLEKVQMFLNKIPELEKTVFDYLLKSYKYNDDSEEVVKMYVALHLDQLKKNELKALFGTTDIDINLFFSKLALKRIGFYPEMDDQFAIFDIMLPEDVTDYIIAVYFDPNGNIDGLTLES